VDVCRNPMGYSLSLKIPLDLAGIKLGNPFLMEIVSHVNALGTAHCKIRAAWQGSSAPKADQSRYALVVPKT